MDIQAGTSGYSYKGWVGTFYPEKTKAPAMLPYYGERLSTVEINSTFYRLPKASVLETWAEAVPENFRFTIKASRRITHLKRLQNADEETAYLLKSVATLGDKLGALLFQLPPNMKCELDRLDAFLQLLPEGTPTALEFRHESWLDEAVFDRLRARNIPLVLVDDAECDPPELIATADWGYLRLRRPGYDDGQLRTWAHSVAQQEWTRALVYFKHEDAGAGPKMAADFMKMVATPTKRAPATATRTRKPAAKKASRKRAS